MSARRPDPASLPEAPARPRDLTALALGVITLAWALTFAPQLFAGRVFASGDATRYRQFSEFSRARWLVERERTFWNPYVFAGLPATASLADQRPQYLPDLAIDAVEWWHRLPGRPPLAGPLLAHLAGMIAMGLLARALWRAGPLGIAWAGIAWGLIPNLLVPIAHGHDAQFVSASLIPVLLLATETLFASRDAPGAFASALALAGGLALQCLTGHPQIIVYGLVLTTALAIESAFRHERLPRLALVAGAGALGMVIAAAVWWPALLYGRQSVRGGGGGVSLAEVAHFSHAPRDLLTLIWPHGVGFGGATYWGGLRQTDYPHYSGVLVVLLALAGLGRRDDGRGGSAVMLGIAALAAVLLSLGTRLGPAFDLLHRHIPLLSGFRVAVAIMIVAQLALALLSARGLERLLAASPGTGARTGRTLALGGAFALVVGWMIAFGPGGGLYQQWVLAARHIFDGAAAAARAAGVDLAFRGALVAAFAGAIVLVTRARGRSGVTGVRVAIGVVVIALLAVDLASVSVPTLARSTAPRERLLPPPPTALARLAADDPLHRALPLEREWFQSNAWVSWRARSLAGLHGAVPVRWDQLMGAGALRRPALMRALAVRFVATEAGITVDPAQCAPVVREGRTLPVCELRGALPRAYTVPRVVAPSSDAQVVSALLAPDFDPRSVACAAEPRAAGDYPGSPRATLRWRVDEPDRLVIDCDTRGRTFLVVADAHAPGWTATVDGRATPLYRVNHLVRGVAVPRGRHRVTMRYLPEGWTAAVRATRVGLVAWLALAVAWGVADLRRRSARPRADGVATPRRP